MKTLQDLTLLDKFLFDQAMDMPEAQEAALQIILQNDDLSLLIPPHTEKEIRTIHECVQRIKSNEEMGVKYMQSWEEKIIERETGIAEGWSISILEILEKLGDIPNEIRNLISAQQDINTLKIWLKGAINSKNIEEFIEKTGN